MTHTPGPWSFDLKGCETSYGFPIITKANGHLIAMLCDKNEANAILLAAAPALAEAVKALGVCGPCGGSGRYQENKKRLNDPKRVTRPQDFKPETVCRKCGGSGLNPIASEVLKKAGVL